MYADIYGPVRHEAFIHEFYRNCSRDTELSEILASSLPERPTRGLAWRFAILAKFGDLLIATGTRVKKLAQPQVVLS